MIKKLLEDFAKLPEIEAIAIGGSRASDVYDEKSDYDIYLYCVKDVEPSIRRDILVKYCSYMEIDNCFWEREDNCTLENGIDIDVLYRNIDSFAGEISSVVEKYEPHNGYTTCMWHNLKTCKIIYDKNGRLEQIKQRFNVSYPTQLKENIINRNIKLLYEYMPAYKYQIKKAVEREDLVSICHRTAAFMESYFDIIWALNELTHPGEKRLVSLCLQKCKVLPNNFKENIDKLYKDLFVNLDNVNSDLEVIILELKKVL